MTSKASPRDDTTSATRGFEKHDHSECVASAIASVEERCAAAGLRLTPVRRKVLELLLQEHKAMGAYAILDLLRDAGFGSQPPVAYRALEFLSSHGFVHKVERLNAFVACVHPGEEHAPAFMICRNCDAVAETHSVPAAAMLEDAAEAAGFQIEKAVLEVEGLCPSCTEQPSPA